MSTTALTHEAISQALAENAPLSSDQRAALLKLVADDKRKQIDYDQSVKDGARWRALLEMCGHWQDGSQQSVKLWQDDATRTCGITVDDGFGRTARWFVERGSFNAAIDAYRAAASAT